ncbi:MAG: hypothetical protein AAF915_05800 [Cyanobacteria bacterium P01_D01_bin.50]
MARPIERIEQDIVELEKAIGAIAQQLKNAYSSYLDILGQAVGQQLILASYHLCTQGYPENFLKLSLNQRQKFQQAIRHLAKVTAKDMQALINDRELEETEEDLVEETEEETEEELDTEDEDLSETFQNLELEDEDLEQIVEKLELDDVVQEAQTFSQTADSSSVPQNIKIPYLPSPSAQSPVQSPKDTASKDWKNWFNPNTSNPMELAAWQKNLERAIAYILKSLSRDGNRLLQKASILPPKLPESILETAVASSEASTEVMPGVPNLITLVVGIEGEQELEAESLTQIMALNLRLIEIEFADIKLSSERKQIRNILNHLGKLGREYQKKQRERSIANAEAAWRSSWYED